MEIKKVWENIEFTLKIFFCSDGEIKSWAINLMSEIDKNIPIKDNEFIVSYPWEYEKDGIYVIALEWNAQKLSYFVFDYNENTSFAFLQDGEILEKLDTVKQPETWFFKDKSVEEQLDKLGFEGERKLIENISDEDKENYETENSENTEKAEDSEEKTEE